MTDPMQRAVEVLARALPRVTMDASRESARALLAEIAPMIVADSDRRRANHAKLYASRGTE